MATNTRPYAIRNKATGELLAAAVGVSPRDALGLYTGWRFSVAVATPAEMYELGKRQIALLERGVTPPEPEDVEFPELSEELRS